MKAVLDSVVAAGWRERSNQQIFDLSRPLSAVVAPPKETEDELTGDS